MSLITAISAPPDAPVRVERSPVRAASTAWLTALYTGCITLTIPITWSSMARSKRRIESLKSAISSS